MGKTLIKVDCIDQRLIVTSAPTLASGGKNEDYVDFNFCDKWDGFEKVGVFYRDIKDPYRSTIDPTGRCVIPWEVLTSNGYIFFGAFGVKGDITRTTEILKYKVKLGAITEDLKPSDPTPELWEQILARIAEQDAEMEVIREALSKKVDAVEGMGLSSNDYTDDDKLAVEQNRTDIEGLGADLSAFEKNRSFDLTGNPIQVESFEGMPLNPVTVLEPQQSGSGDPYPAGGGKNLVPVSTRAGGSAHNGVTWTNDNDGSWTANGTASGNSYAEGTSNLINLGVLEAGAHVVSISPASAASIIQARIGKGSASTYVISTGGAVEATFNADGTSEYVLALSVSSGVTAENVTAFPQVEAGSVATAYAPYSNIRPFIGWDALGLVRHGRNMYNNVYDGSKWVETNSSYPKLPFKCVPGKTYSWSLVGNAFADSGAYAVFTDQLDFNGGNYNGGLRQWIGLGSAGASNAEFGTFVAPDSGVFYIGILSAQGNKALELLKDLMLVEGAYTADTMPDYEPYQGNTYTVQIGQTVYGGRMDWLTGKLTAEWALKTLDGTESFTHYDGWANKYAYYCDSFMSGAVSIVGNDAVANILCSHAAAKAPNGFTLVTYNGAFVGQGVGVRLYICLGEYATADELKAYLAAQYAAGTPVQIAYKLATPVEIQLDAHEILALQGINTLYGDGEINISGRTDMQAVVSNLLKRIAVLENKVNATE